MENKIVKSVFGLAKLTCVIHEYRENRKERSTTRHAWNLRFVFVVILFFVKENIFKITTYEKVE